MRAFETIVFEEKEGVAWIRMNRPEELNALNLTMGKELCEIASLCSTEKAIRAVVVTGVGRAFCAGGDVKEMHRHLKETGRADLFLRDLALYLHTFVAEVVRMPKPVIAAINGIAAGGGLSMSLACDLSFARQDARFVMAYTNIGLVPDGSSTYFLSKIVGPKKAREMIFLNEPLDADEALRLGIVNRVFPKEEFEREVASIAIRLSRGPTDTYGRVKGLLRLGLIETLESQMENERHGVSLSSLHGEFREGVTAFVEKRRADFLSVKG
ncbi:MAG: enoyl-CoA hydratase [Candidatus Bathyarchaeia archaeon]